MDNYVFDEEGKIPEELLEEESSEEGSSEEGFMKGYRDEEEVHECAECGATVDEEHKVVREVGDEMFVFCSKECADEFEEGI